MNAKHSRRRLLPLGIVVIVALPAVIAVLIAVIGSLRADHVLIEVPPGTAARIDAGEQVELIPRVLEVAVGDTIEIRNHDSAPHEVGPYYVAAGQTVRQTFMSPGEIVGMCSLHPSGEVTIIVR